MQFPKWRGLALQRVSASGTAHAVFRLGGRLAARFRLEADDVELVWSDLRAEVRRPGSWRVVLGSPPGAGGDRRAGQGLPDAVVGSEVA